MTPHSSESHLLKDVLGKLRFPKPLPICRKARRLRGPKGPRHLLPFLLIFIGRWSFYIGGSLSFTPQKSTFRGASSSPGPFLIRK